MCVFNCKTCIIIDSSGGKMNGSIWWRSSLKFFNCQARLFFFFYPSRIRMTCDWRNSKNLQIYKQTFLFYSETGATIMSVVCQCWNTISEVLQRSASLSSEFNLVELGLEKSGQCAVLRTGISYSNEPRGWNYRKDVGKLEREGDLERE